MLPLKNILFEFLGSLGVGQLPYQKRYWKWLRLLILFSIDFLLIGFSYWAAFILRFDDGSLGAHWSSFKHTLIIALICQASVFAFGGMYRQIWRYANLHSAFLIGRCVVVGTLLMVSVMYLLAREYMPPRSIPIIFSLLVGLLVSISKFSWRAWASLRRMVQRSDRESCLIYGAGAAGDLLSRHISADPRFPYKAVGYIDDDPNKRHRKTHGLPILGTKHDLISVCLERNIKTVIFAMHSPSGKIVRDLVVLCHEAGVRPLIMPEMANSLGSEVIRPRNIDVKDLLRRSPKSIDRARVDSFFAGKIVLVTGAGGSIGSEICRQILDSQPKQLILLDSSEFNLYQVDQELRAANSADIKIIPLLGSTRSLQIVDDLFERYKPSYVIHTAAYKHVPMVESNPIEGILNNVLGTQIVAEAAIRHGVERFLLISTDKAVRPTNVMGATKRCCEILVQSLNDLAGGSTQFCAVRFGNVLGSSGSVIPLFLSQIKRGGPLTVTHPEVTRFFMLINEAVGLVLEALTRSTGGDIFVLNMGEPVKIYDMAKQLILLAGKVPGKDIEIVFSGLRPGEKLYEELILEGAEQCSTHEDLYIAVPNASDARENLAVIERIVRFASEGEHLGAIKLLMKMASPTSPIAMGNSPAPFEVGDAGLH